ncbi:MAG: hypothetical protein KGJ53_14150, partial [Alphaproteobacteria bacterium]|nr:hypothetical protein [Alphaproteobacteria bacterium]
KPILSHAAKLIGHYEGLSESVYDEEGALKAALQKSGLEMWFERYQNDLRRFWDMLGDWQSFDEFLALGGHVERLLWQFGMILWEDEEGMCRVEVPLATDAQRLSAHIQSNLIGDGQGPPG